MKITKRLSKAWHVLRSETNANTELRPDDDFWYRGGPGYRTASGYSITPDTAMRVAAVYACIRVIAETIASLPLDIYQKMPNGGRQKATAHPLYRTIARRPNNWQTAYEFWEMMQGHLELRGNAYAIKVGDINGPYGQLIPVHPDRVLIWRLPTGFLQYQIIRLGSAQIDTFRQDEIFHLRGLSSDGLVGISTIAACAETIGVGYAAQQYAGRFFDNDATPGGVMIHPKTLTKGAHQRIKDSWKEYFTSGNAHGTAILEEGMQYQNIGVTNKDSQLLEARQFSRGDIASMFRVPPHKIGDLSRATFSNIEQQNIEFATDAIRPRLVRLERKINEDLIEPLQIGAEGEYYSEFLLDAIMRGDLKTRYEAYSSAIYAGFMTRAQAREFENWNPIQGLDKPLMPVNQAVLDDQGNPQPLPGFADQGGAPPTTGSTFVQKRLEMFVDGAVQRVVRREVSELTKAFKRSGDDLGLLRAEIESFYASGFREILIEQLRLSKAAADLYMARNRQALLDCKTAQQAMYTMFEIEKKAPEILLDLAMPRVITPRKVRVLEEFGGDQNALSAHNCGSDADSLGDPQGETSADPKSAIA